jgi:excisionase family DNA binding protein
MKTYTLREAAAALGVSRQRIYRLVDRLGVPTTIVDGVRRLTAEQVRAIRHRPENKGGRPRKLRPKKSH